MEPTLSQAAFDKFRSYLYERTGIQLAPTKKGFVTGRLWRRVRELQLASYDEYFDYVVGGINPDEPQVMLDLLTTNETSFFREMPHFDFLREHARQHRDVAGPIRVWSAACSTGEEPYSIAMVLDDALGTDKWQVVASDICRSVLDAARAGVYTAKALTKVPARFARRYFEPAGEGGISVVPALRHRIAFKHVNLNGEWPVMGSFDLIFLRNVIIYFDMPTRHRLIMRLLKTLKPGGFLFTGHAENIMGMSQELSHVQPSVYTIAPRRAAR